MNSDNRAVRRKRWLYALRSYAVYFLLIAFVISCCMFLFLTVLRSTTGMTFTEENIGKAALLTFINVFLLALIFTVIEVIRRMITVERPLKRILNVCERLMKGDFSARIEPLRGIDEATGFNTIIDYINRMAKELGSVETLRTDFISNVSHELKTPLAVMQNYGVLLQGPDLSDKKRIEYAKALTESSRRLADLITNILKLNRLENQQIYPEVKRYNLGEQLAECLLNFETTWEQKEIEIETDLEEEVFIDSDEELLSLVWNNLFSNALKFTEPHGTVSVSLKPEGTSVYVRVTDTGCGISQETGNHIFEKFYQGDTSHAAQGNGLGLALVKQVMDIMGGDVSVVSELGKGSAFTVKLEKFPVGETERKP